MKLIPLLLELDFRFNYLQNFDLSFAIILTTLSGNIINYYKIYVNNYIETTEASDFENVDCIFIYHDPETTTDPSFQYPNNNIEIIRDPSFDTFEKAIVNLPELRTATTNLTFLPAKNGSNLSRKQIQGLIGFNDIPRLLSIQPYDENFIVGRGFVNQFQLGDSCISEEQKIKNKVNISKEKQKHMDNSHLSKIKFANLVRSNKRQKLSQSQVLSNTQCDVNSNSNIPTNSNQYITPFRLFTGRKTSRGKYLGPK